MNIIGIIKGVVFGFVGLFALLAVVAVLSSGESDDFAPTNGMLQVQAEDRARAELPGKQLAIAQGASAAVKVVADGFMDLRTLNYTVIEATNLMAIYGASCHMSDGQGRCMLGPHVRAIFSPRKNKRSRVGVLEIEVPAYGDLGTGGCDRMLNDLTNHFGEGKPHKATGGVRWVHEGTRLHYIPSGHVDSSCYLRVT